MSLPDPLTERTPLAFDIEVPIHIAYNKLRQVQILEGPAPYGISTENRITKRILQQGAKQYCLTPKGNATLQSISAAIPKKTKINPIETALMYKKTYQSLPNPTIRETAQILGVSKGRVHQMLNLLKLDERILEYLLHKNTGENYTERQLRSLLHLPIEDQFKSIEKYHMSKQAEFSASSLKQLRLSLKLKA